MVKFTIGGVLTIAGLVLMTMANRQMIDQAECLDCDDQVTISFEGKDPGTSPVIEEAGDD